MKKISLLAFLFSAPAFAGSFYPIDQVERGFTVIEYYPALGLAYVAEEGGFANKEHTINAVPWGLDRIDQAALPLDSKKYELRGNASVTAYIVDTGIVANDEFEKNIAEGFDAVKGEDTKDCVGHGTHVAGTIGSLNYGVAFGTTLVPIKVFGCSSSTSTQIILRGLNYVAENAKLPAVVNMSLGGGADDALDAGTAAVVAKGIHVVVAAGNSYGADACKYSPARLGKDTPVITVGATAISDKMAYFSNQGACVNIYAPGEDIESISASGGTEKMSGTSMASPHTAGAVALYLAKNPESKPEDTKKYIVEHGTPDVVTKSGKVLEGAKLLFVD